MNRKQLFFLATVYIATLALTIGILNAIEPKEVWTCQAWENSTQEVYRTYVPKNGTHDVRIVGSFEGEQVSELIGYNSSHYLMTVSLLQEKCAEGSK